jgi:hypothetical protein
LAGAAGSNRILHKLLEIYARSNQSTAFENSVVSERINRSCGTVEVGSFNSKKIEV